MSDFPFTNAELWEAIYSAVADGHVFEAGEVEQFPEVIGCLGDDASDMEVDWFRSGKPNE